MSVRVWSRAATLASVLTAIMTVATIPIQALEADEAARRSDVLSDGDIVVTARTGLSSLLSDTRHTLKEPQSTRQKLNA